MPRRKMVIRCEHHRGPEPLVEIDEEEESILNVDHEGGDWWVYIARWADDDCTSPLPPNGRSET